MLPVECSWEAAPSGSTGGGYHGDDVNVLNDMEQEGSSGPGSRSNGNSV